MRLGQEVRTTITPQVIVANDLLQMSSVELDLAVSKALAENPALEMRSPILCERCGTALLNGSCPLCSTLGRNATIREESDGWWNEEPRWRVSRTVLGGDEDFDPLTLVAAEVSLSQHLHTQIAPLLEPEEAPIALFVIDSLDERGYFPATVAEAAAHLNRSEEEVEAVLAKVQSLDPVGVGARSLQECLLIQLAQMDQNDPVVGSAFRLVTSAWESLSHLSMDSIARQLRMDDAEIAETIEYIGRNLNPFPANADWNGPGHRPEGSSLQPDIIVRRKDSGDVRYEIEIPDSRKYRLRVNGLYQQMAQDVRMGACQATLHEAEHLREHLAQARLFINCVRQRWQTLERIALALVDIQEDFLEHGYRHLRPLTRAELADIVGVHESTVGRAVASKAMMLPNGRIIPLSDLFDGSLAVKCVIEEIILQENEALSDQRITEELQDRGYDVKRRTVTKYRDAIGIPQSRVRAAVKGRTWGRPLWSSLEPVAPL